MEVFKRISGLIFKFKPQLFGGIFFMILYGIFNVAPAKYVKNIVDSLSSGDVPKLERFFLIGGAVVLLFFLKGISYFGQNYLMGNLGQGVIRDLRHQLFEQVVLLPTAFFSKKSSGDLISRFTTDLTTFNQSITVCITGPLRDLPQILLLLGLMLYSSWKLFLVTLILLPIAAGLINKFGKKNKAITSKRQNKFGELTSLLTETIMGIRVVKAFSMEEYEIDRFKNENDRLFKYYMRSIKVGSYSFPILELIGATCGAVIMSVGGYLIVHGEITGGDFASFIVSFFMLNEPIKKLNNFTLKVQEGISAAQRVFEILDNYERIVDKANASELPTIKDNIHIKVDNFTYDGENSVLRNIDLTVEAGKITAFVGASGSGKTTITNLLPRFYELNPKDGSVKIDGEDIQNVTLDSLRKQISIVTQDVVLFNDTISNNISYGDINCSENDIIEAAKAGFADKFISEMPNKYQQQVGERGSNLSGGQRQRIAISRALIKNAPILILDEATSALDTESEQEVQAAIENLMKNRTTLVIAHRLSTIQHADIIHVMKNGEIIESGTHDELLELNGEYKKLYTIQFNNPAEYLK